MCFLWICSQTVSELEDHAIEVHEQYAQIVRKFNEHNYESIKMLENVPVWDWILTPEEVTHFGVDWKIHLELLNILENQANWGKKILTRLNDDLSSFIYLYL